MESQTQLIKQDQQLREDNAQVCATFFNDLTGAIERVTPAFRQLFYDFAHLSKGETIMGCNTQSEWARKYANKSAEALRLTLKRSQPVSHQKQTPPNPAQLPTVKENPTKPTIVGSIDEIELVHEEVGFKQNDQAQPESLPISHDDSWTQKLQASLSAERILVQDLKRLVRLVLGDETNLWHLSEETRRLYERLME